MKILYINRVEWLEQLMDELLKFGYERVSEDPDVILGMTNSLMNESEEAYKKYPRAFKIQYNWDLYGWFFSVIKTYIVPFEEDVADERYILMPLRELPDQQYSWFKSACDELGLPYVISNHQLPFEEYKKVVARCSFIVSPLYEASTGGLTLLEGYYLGKPVLISDSPYMGAKDYFGGRAWYFDTYDDLKSKLQTLWNDTPKLNRSECRDWVLENYSVIRMAKEVDYELHRI